MENKTENLTAEYDALGGASSDLIARSAGFFKALGDETRIKILCAIAEREVCVNDIASRVGMTKSAVSHQLRLLKDHGLIKCRRMGKSVLYSLDDRHVADMLQIVFAHMKHTQK